MPVQSLTWDIISEMRAVLLEAGCEDNRWTLAADARIKTATNKLGVGPVVYKARPTDAEGNYSSSGTVKDACFMFFDDQSPGYGVAMLEDSNPTDIDLTIEDFLTNNGGDVASMRTNNPNHG